MGKPHPNHKGAERWWALVSHWKNRFCCPDMGLEKQAWGRDLKTLRPWWGCASQVALVVKIPPANAGDLRDPGSIPELGKSPGGGHSNPLQYLCLENPMDTEARQVTVHRVTQSQA